VHVCHFAFFGSTKQKLLNLELISSFKIKNGFFSPLRSTVLRWVTDLPRGLIYLGTVTGIVLRWVTDLPRGLIDLGTVTGIVLRWVTDLRRGLIHLGTVTGIVLRWMMSQEV
jgi:hypothetical protein